MFRPLRKLRLLSRGDSLHKIKRHKRIGRKIENKIALFYNLYAKGTIEETWVRNRTKTLNPIWTDKIVAYE